MKKGQVWRLQADYDFKKSNGMVHSDGSLDEVMGLSVLFIRTKG
jgi:hypothetical protein